MAKHPIAHRTHRRKSEEPEDAFVARMMEVGMWARQHMTALLLGGGILAVAVLLTAYYVNYQRTLEARATTRLTELRQVTQSGNRPLAIRDLETFISRFGSTHAAAEGRLILASLQLQEGIPEAAAETVRRLAGDVDTPVGTNAAFLLAATQEQRDLVDEAIDTYLRIGEAARFDFERRRALENAARLSLNQDDTAAAVAFLERIVNGMESGDPERSYYQMLLAEARAAQRAAQTG